MKAAIYLRVSTDRQAREGFSLEAQEEMLSSFVESQGWELVKKYVDDGFSGKNMDRPKLQELLIDAQDVKWNILVLYSPDRLSRSIVDQAAIRNILEKKGVELKFLTVPIDTSTAEGDLITNILGCVSQYERKLLGNRVKMGMKIKAQKGGFNGMSAPLGYDIIEGELRINRKEAEIVRSIFTMHEIGMCLESITILLNEFDVPTKKGRTWSKKQVWRILHSEIVRGYLRWDGIVTKGTHPAIIEKGMSNVIYNTLTSKKLLFNKKGENFVKLGKKRNEGIG